MDCKARASPGGGDGLCRSVGVGEEPIGRRVVGQRFRNRLCLRLPADAGSNEKFIGLAQLLGQLYDAKRDFHSNCWDNLRILGQPCGCFVSGAGRASDNSVSPGGSGAGLWVLICPADLLLRQLPTVGADRRFGDLHLLGHEVSAPGPHGWHSRTGLLSKAAGPHRLSVDRLWDPAPRARLCSVLLPVPVRDTHTHQQ